MPDEETTTTAGTRRRGRPRGSKNKTDDKPSNGASASSGTKPKRTRRKKADGFDPSQLTFEQVIATVKYAQEKLGDLGPILPPQD